MRARLRSRSATVSSVNTGVRTFGGPFTEPMFFDYIAEHSSMSDVNNGILRPQSPCIHSKCKISPTPLKPSYYADVYGSFSVDPQWKIISAGQFAEYFEAQIAPVVNYAIEKSQRRLLRQHQLTERYSSINFFTELADAGALFKGIRKSVKKWAKSKRYIDYQFGVAPIFSDVSKAWNSYADSIDAINAKIDAASVRDVFSKTDSQSVNSDVEVSFFVGDRIQLKYELNVTTRVKGTYYVEYPRLEPMDRSLAILFDRLGFHPDLSTVWEAIPYSWLIDWVYPFGDYLTSISNGWMSPTIMFDGNISSKVTGGFTWHTAIDQGFEPAGQGYYKYYNRSGARSLNFSVESLARIPSIQLPTITASRFGVINDIWGEGSSISDFERIRLGGRPKLRR